MVLALFVGSAILASAQAPRTQANTRSLSLQECIDLALNKNLDLKIQQASAEIARLTLTGAYAAYVPNFSISARHDFVSQPPDFDPKKPGIDSPYEVKTDLLTSELKGRMPFGLSYDLSALGGEHDARTDFRLLPNTARDYPGGIRRTNDYFSEAGLTLNQHLLRDFWIDSYRQTILLRRKDLKISGYALQFQVMRTVLGVELAYYDFVAAREGLAVQEKALQLKQQFVAETKRRVEVGELPPLESEQAETQLENTLTALAGARQVLVESQNLLKALITDSFQEWVDTEITPSDRLLAVPAEANRGVSFHSALKNRPDLLEVRLALEKSDIEIRFRRNQLFPNLDAIGHYGGQGISPELSGSASDTVHFRNPIYFYGVVMSFPLSNLKERSDYRASKAFREIAQLQLDKAEQAILLDVANYLTRVQSRFSQVGSTRKARQYAESALEAEQKKLQNGYSTTFIVLQLQETLTAARTAEVLALADYNKALAQLDFTRGITLAKYHLDGQARE